MSNFQHKVTLGILYVSAFFIKVAYTTSREIALNLRIYRSYQGLPSHEILLWNVNVRKFRLELNQSLWIGKLKSFTCCNYLPKTYFPLWFRDSLKHLKGFPIFNTFFIPTSKLYWGLWIKFRIKWYDHMVNHVGLLKLIQEIML